MKSLKLVMWLAVSLLIACQSKPTPQTDTGDSETMSESQVRYEVGQTLFENEYARVVQASLAPGEEQPEHEGKERVIYSMNDYTLQWSEENLEIGTIDMNAGEVHFHRAGIHAGKNVSVETAHFLIFERKTDELPPCGENTADRDVASLEGGFATTLFENSLFKVNKVKIDPGVEIPEHSGINRLIYALTDFTINYTSDLQESGDATFNAGDLHWHDACKHSVKNVGDTTAEFLVVAYKERTTG